ncbi:MAG: ubiquinol-cytochrome c reductase iron-sulfur subunit, partial [Gammaproteobacteria bacterium]|nr:ubiquinol-cytochrome c reductase iron-sulfur subunit [Gammaproteobacteria bacterium]
MAIEQNKSRRRFLVNATTVVGVTGIAAASWPFIASMNPSEKARQSGAAIRIDFSKIEPGQQITVEWRQKPVWILHRTQAMLENMNQPKHLNQLRDPDSEVTS